MKNVTMRQLRIFSAVAQHLSFARAAESLHLTPPAVSMQVKELEVSVGLPLFDRTGRRVSLTTTGEYMLSYARRVLAVMKDAEDTVARFRGLTGGQLAIGMVSTAEYFLPQFLARFRDEHPGVALSLQVGTREQVVAMMQGNEVDLAIMGRPPKEWATRAEPFALHPHVVVTAVDHPFVRQGGVQAVALAGEAFIIREQGSATRALLETYLQQHHVEMRATMEMTSNEAIKQAVMAGLGVAFVSVHAVRGEVASHRLAAVRLRGLRIRRHFHAIHSEARTLSAGARAFVAMLVEQADVPARRGRAAS